MAARAIVRCPDVTTVPARGPLKSVDPRGAVLGCCNAEVAVQGRIVSRGASRSCAFLIHGLPHRCAAANSWRNFMSAMAAVPKKESDSITVIIIERTLLLCALAPFALVALVLRLALARVFFLAGQDKIDGPVVPLVSKYADLSFMLPAQIKDAALRVFETHFTGTTVPQSVTAYLFAYAEFILPIFVVLGFATRYSAAALFAITVLTQIYIAPEAFWTLHIYLLSMLLVLMTCGPGDVSVDRLIRYIHER
jgi:putative oxidoreductase